MIPDLELPELKSMELDAQLRAGLWNPLSHLLKKTTTTIHKQKPRKNPASFLPVCLFRFCLDLFSLPCYKPTTKAAGEILMMSSWPHVTQVLLSAEQIPDLTGILLLPQNSSGSFIVFSGLCLQEETQRKVVNGFQSSCGQEEDGDCAQETTLIVQVG